MAEKDEANHDVHQDDYGSDTEHIVQSSDANEVRDNNHGGEATIIKGNLQYLLRSKKQSITQEDSENEEEDDTVLQYYSDGDNDNNDDMYLDEEHEDF